MPCSSTIEKAIALAEQRWPGLEFRRKSDQEASASCPFCKQATDDGFLIFADDSMRFWCRKCGQSGFLNRDDGHKLTSEELTEIRLRRLEREQDQLRRRLSALERLNQTTDHITYHKLLDADDRAWWHGEGINDASIDEYQLGVCYRCPTDVQHRPSYTIPIQATTGELLNIQHRLIGPVSGDRYRPHMAGLPSKVLFNARHAINGHSEAFLVEGCKKSIVMCQHSCPAMAVLNKYGFKMEWLLRFTVKTLTLCPDPDAIEAWTKLGQDIAAEGFTVNVVRLPMKPDDLLTVGSTADFEHYLSLSRRLH